MASVNPPSQAALTVQLCASWQAGQVEEKTLSLQIGSTVGEALAASGWNLAEDAPCGVWGRLAPRSQVLQAGDRVEIYRPLTADPKTARRERFARQGARAAGLFARKKMS